MLLLFWFLAMLSSVSRADPLNAGIVRCVHGWVIGAGPVDLSVDIDKPDPRGHIQFAAYSIGPAGGVGSLLAQSNTVQAIGEPGRLNMPFTDSPLVFFCLNTDSDAVEFLPSPGAHLAARRAFGSWPNTIDDADFQPQMHFGPSLKATLVSP
jgi:hypothetical protein